MSIYEFEEMEKLENDRQGLVDWKLSSKYEETKKEDSRLTATIIALLQVYFASRFIL